MATYVVLLPGDEAAWDAKPQDEKEQTYARHQEFAAAARRARPHGSSERCRAGAGSRRRA